MGFTLSAFIIIICDCQYSTSPGKMRLKIKMYISKSQQCESTHVDARGSPVRGEGPDVSYRLFESELLLPGNIPLQNQLDLIFEVIKTKFLKTKSRITCAHLSKHINDLFSNFMTYSNACKGYNLV